MGFLGGSVIKNLPASAGAAGSVPGSGITAIAWTTFHGVAKSQTLLSN